MVGNGWVQGEVWKKFPLSIGRNLRVYVCVKELFYILIVVIYMTLSIFEKVIKPYTKKYEYY